MNDLLPLAQPTIILRHGILVSRRDTRRLPRPRGKVEPPTYLAYRWASAFPGEELREDNCTLVEFTLIQEGDKTRLRVVESGFSALAGDVRDVIELRRQAVRDNTGGWAEELDALKTRAEASSM